MRDVIAPVVAGVPTVGAGAAQALLALPCAAPRLALAQTDPLDALVLLEDATLHRDPGEVETVRLRYHAEPLACRVHVQEDGALELELRRWDSGAPCLHLGTGRLRS
jgi:hypothetical protein